MRLETKHLAAIDAALARVEGVLHLHHGTACLDEDGDTLTPLDLAAAITDLRAARDALGVAPCAPMAVTPAREVLANFWPTRDLSRFPGSWSRSHAAASTP